MVVAHEAALTPGLFPCVIMAGGLGRDDRKPTLKLVLIGKQEAEPAFGQYRRTIEVDPVEWSPLSIDVDRHSDPAIRRGHGFLGSGRLRKHDCREKSRHYGGQKAMHFQLPD